MNGPHWDFSDLCKRLRPDANSADSAEGQLRREAAEAILALMETNKELHRRAQKVESPMERKLGRAKRDAGFYGDWAISNWNRMMAAHNEIKLIYDQIRRVRPDGCEGRRYHSVNDMKFGDDATPPGTVWANVFKSKEGGIVSVRPVEAIVDVVEEVIKLCGALREG